jgi:hypothetical protein
MAADGDRGSNRCADLTRTVQVSRDITEQPIARQATTADAEAVAALLEELGYPTDRASAEA